MTFKERLLGAFPALASSQNPDEISLTVQGILLGLLPLASVLLASLHLTFSQQNLTDIINAVVGLVSAGMVAYGVYQKIAKPMGDREFGAVRSPQWPEVRKAHLKDHPICEVCGSKVKLQVHHIHPFHLHPELELDPTNLITLCEKGGAINCHLAIGHLGNFKSFNVDVASDSKVCNNKLLTRPTP